MSTWTTPTRLVNDCRPRRIYDKKLSPLGNCTRLPCDAATSSTLTRLDGAGRSPVHLDDASRFVCRTSRPWRQLTRTERRAWTVQVDGGSMLTSMR